MQESETAGASAVDAPPEALLTTAEATALVGRSDRTLRRWESLAAVEPIRSGGRKLYRREELLAASERATVARLAPLVKSGAVDAPTRMPTIAPPRAAAPVERPPADVVEERPRRRLRTEARTVVVERPRPPVADASPFERTRPLPEPPPGDLAFTNAWASRGPFLWRALRPLPAWAQSFLETAGYKGVLIDPWSGLPWAGLRVLMRLAPQRAESVDELIAVALAAPRWLRRRTAWCVDLVDRGELVDVENPDAPTAEDLDELRSRLDAARLQRELYDITRKDTHRRERAARQAEAERVRVERRDERRARRATRCRELEAIRRDALARATWTAELVAGIPLPTRVPSRVRRRLRASLEETITLRAFPPGRSLEDARAAAVEIVDGALERRRRHARKATC